MFASGDFNHLGDHFRYMNLTRVVSTDPFVVPVEMFDIIEGMKSNLMSEEE